MSAVVSRPSLSLLRRGLLTLLEFYSRIAFDLFHACFLCDIYAVPADIPVIVLHYGPETDYQQPLRVDRAACGD